MNHQFTIIALLFCGTLQAMELDNIKDSKKEIGTQSNFELGMYNDDYELLELPSVPFKNQKKRTTAVITKPYIPEDTEANSSCCSLLMIFLNSWNYSHGYMYSLSSSPK